MSDLFRVSVWAVRSGKLRAEILFNRALIWSMIGLMESRAGNEVTTWLAIVAACCEICKAISAWIEVDE